MILYSQYKVKHKPVKKICQCPSAKNFKPYFSLGVEGGPIYSYRRLVAPSFLFDIQQERNAKEKPKVGYQVAGFTQFHFHPLFSYELALGYLHHEYTTNSPVQNRITQITDFPLVQYQVYTNGILMRHCLWYTYWGLGRFLPQLGLGLSAFFLQKHYFDMTFFNASQQPRQTTQYIPSRQDIALTQYSLNPMIGFSYIVNQSLFFIGRVGLGYYLTPLYLRQSIKEYLLYPYLTIGTEWRF